MESGLKDLRELKTSYDLATRIVDRHLTNMLTLLEHSMPVSQERYRETIKRIKTARAILSAFDRWIRAQARKEGLSMECKIFYSRSRKEIEKQVNAWLKEHPVSPDSMRFEFSSVVLDDPDEHIVEHTLVLFYVPMRAI